MQAESVLAFSSDPKMVNFARLFLEQTVDNDSQVGAGGDSENHMMQLLTALVYECITQDKRMILSIWITVLKVGYSCSFFGFGTWR